MPLPISIAPGTVQWDSLPVLKLKHYPFTEGSYKPYTLARVCIQGDSLLVRLWSFEAETLVDETDMLSGSCIHLFLKKGDTCLAVTVAAGGGFKAQADKGEGFVPLYELSSGIPDTQWFGGEDLQGIYWGCEVTLGPEIIRDLFGTRCLLPGSEFLANVTKTQFDPQHFHYGSLFQINEREPAFYLPASLGEFSVVNY